LAFCVTKEIIDSIAADEERVEPVIAIPAEIFMVY